MLTFVVESINPVDTRALVVPAEDKEVFGILDLLCRQTFSLKDFSMFILHSYLISKEEAYGFQTLLSTIYIVAEKEVIGFGREATVFKQSKEIIVLSVNVACRGQKGLAFD